MIKIGLDLEVLMNYDLSLGTVGYYRKFIKISLC